MRDRIISQPGPVNAPKPVRVQAGAGKPVTVAGERVESVLEDWLLQDRWWTDNPMRRRYWKVVTITGRCLVVFHDVLKDGWYTQAA
jgi:hypothetical protein